MSERINGREYDSLIDAWFKVETSLTILQKQVGMRSEVMDSPDRQRLVITVTRTWLELLERDLNSLEEVVDRL